MKSRKTSSYAQLTDTDAPLLRHPRRAPANQAVLSSIANTLEGCRWKQRPRESDRCNQDMNGRWLIITHITLDATVSGQGAAGSSKTTGVISCYCQYAVWCHCLLLAKHMVRTFCNQVFWREILLFNLLPEGTPLHLPDADFELPYSEGIWATPEHSDNMFPM